MVAGLVSQGNCSMTKLSDTQLVILSAACRRNDRRILPLPSNLKGGAATKVIESLLRAGLVEEIVAEHGEPVWRRSDDENGMTLVATPTAFEALGIARDETPASAATSATEREEPDTATTSAPDADSAPIAPVAAEGLGPRKAREGTKQAQLIDMLRTPEGATIAEIVIATGWQAHTVRGAMAGALKKKLGLDVTSEKVEGRGRVYKLPTA